MLFQHWRQCEGVQTLPSTVSGYLYRYTRADIIKVLVEISSIMKMVGELLVYVQSLNWGLKTNGLSYCGNLQFPDRLYFFYKNTHTTAVALVSILQSKILTLIYHTFHLSFSHPTYFFFHIQSSLPQIRLCTHNHTYPFLQ